MAHRGAHRGDLGRRGTGAGLKKKTCVLVVSPLSWWLAAGRHKRSHMIDRLRQHGQRGVLLLFATVYFKRAPRDTASACIESHRAKTSINISITIIMNLAPIKAGVLYWRCALSVPVKCRVKCRA